MKVVIKPQSETQILVGKDEKLIILDDTFGWTSVTNDLTVNEIRASQMYIKEVIDMNIQPLPTKQYEI